MHGYKTLVYIALNLDSAHIFHSYLCVHNLQSISILHSPWDQKVATKGFAGETFWRIIFAAFFLRGDNYGLRVEVHGYRKNATTWKENLANFLRP